MININSLGLNSVSEGSTNVASSSDVGLFQSGLGGDLRSQINRQGVTQSMVDKATKDLTDTTRETILQYMADQKNKMILESRGSGAKKAAELAKEISF